MKTNRQLSMTANSRTRSITFSIFITIAGLGFAYPLITFASSKGVNLENIKTILINGTDAERRNTASALGMIIPNQIQNDSKKSAVCSVVDAIEISKVPLVNHGPQAVLNITSSMCQYSYLLIFKKKSNNGWNLLKTIPLLAKNSTPRITFEDLLKDGNKEIVVDDLETDTGTGIEQYNLMILKISADRFNVIFDEPKKVVFSIPIKNGSNTNLTENDHYQFVDSEGNKADHSLTKDILQKQVIKQGDKEIVRWWRYSWSPVLYKYIKYPTLP